MPTTYTSLLGLALPATGELSSTWGSTVNTEITSLLDTAIAGTTTLSTDTDVTLSTTTGAANQARQAIILWTANGTVTRNITAPAASKTYVVINASAGTQSIVFRGVGPTAGVTVVKGESAVVAWNGSDFIKVSNTSGAGAFTNLSVSGTTTLSGLTASTALALDASKNVVSVTNTGTGNNVLATSPVLTTPNLGTPSAIVLTNATGLPVSTGISGLGTGVATALAVNTGAAGAFVVNGGALGTPSSGTVTNLTGTAAININGTVGATTPNTGAFTTLSVSGVATFSAGTAAAPALTTIGDTDTGVFFPAANTWAVATGASERMRIDSSGNVGIGTTSPVDRLAIVGSSSGGAIIARVTNSASAVNSAAVISFDPNGNGSNGRDAQIRGINVNGVTQTALAFLTANGATPVEYMRITHDGNVGIGTQSPGGKTEIKSVSSGAVTTALVLSNDVANSANTGVDLRFYVNEGREARYAAIRSVQVAAGNVADLRFLTANSDTPQVRMTITSGGNVGIGTTSPGYALHVANGDIGIKRSATNDGAVFFGSNTNNYIYGGNASNILFFATNGFERMRIDSAGSVGIGDTAIATSRLFIGGLHPSSFTQTQALRISGVFPATTTSEAISVLSRPSTATATYTLSSLVHFYANPDTFGAGSTVSNQYGFVAESTLTAAGQNFGFYGAIAAGTGRWNFYAAGTAPNYFAGDVGVGTASPAAKLHVSGQIRTEAPTGGTAANWRLGTVHTVTPTSPNRTIEVDIGGTIYYLHAKTTNN